MAATPDHSALDADVQGIHVPFQFSFPDEASRTDAPASRLIGGASKLAYQRDTSALWLLASASPTPTWASMGAGIASSGLGGVSEGANLGDGGYGIFREKTGASLLFKTLIPGTAITLSSAASTVTIANDIDGVNLGTGIPVFRETTAGSLSFRSLVGGGNISIASAASTVTVTDAAGELFLAANDGWPSVTNGCASPTKNEYEASGIDLFSLDFDHSASEYAQWSFWMPDSWNGGTVTFKGSWSASAGSGDTMWGLQGRSYADDDGIDQAWGTAQTVIDTLTSINDMCITPISAAITLGGGPAAGEFVQFRAYRNSGSNGDTLSLDARLFGVKVYYTKS